MHGAKSRPATMSVRPTADEFAATTAGASTRLKAEMLADPAGPGGNSRHRPAGPTWNRQSLPAKAGKHVIVEKPLEVALPPLPPHHRGLPQSGRGASPQSFPPASTQSRASSCKAGGGPGPSSRLTMGDAYVKSYRTSQYSDGRRMARGTSGDGRRQRAGDRTGDHSVDLLAWLIGPVAEDPFARSRCWPTAVAPWKRGGRPQCGLPDRALGSSKRHRLPRLSETGSFASAARHEMTERKEFRQ